MNLILLFEDDFTDNGKHVRLSGRRHKHVIEICRASVGDKLCVGLCNAKMGTGCITALDDDALEMDVTLTECTPPALPVTLVLALPRPIVLKRMLSLVSGMGVKRIILFHSKRVEKSYWKSPVLKEENIKKQLILGLEQAKDTIFPKVELQPLFKPFIEDVLADIAKNTISLVAHPQSADPCPRYVHSHVTLVIGPEGGFIPYEIEKLINAGFKPVHLGERILKVETAVPALLSRLF
ncbi:MAG: 16S rRNA (uracil(1498)-N(3))-methyltransferase [Candidatus Omnitrophica bacterium]|nr:16S rRNA (uracil(1498)-N(3))-methyltransferase [Candidatus Omnitrophota bacterium]